MEFRYNFNDKLDLTKFKKQAAHHIGLMKQLNFNIYLPNFVVMAEVITPENCTSHMVTIYIQSIKKNESGEIAKMDAVIPMIDVRFKTIEDIKNLFPIGHYKAAFQSNSAKNTVEKISKIIKIAHKIEKLKALI